MKETIENPVVVDIEFPNVTLYQLAFGSCHNRKKALESLHKKQQQQQQADLSRGVIKNEEPGGSYTESTTTTTLAKPISIETQTIWDTILTNHPNVQGFLWAGDAVYSPVKEGVASVEVLRNEYNQLRFNDTSLGYSSFLDYLDLASVDNGNSIARRSQTTYKNYLPVGVFGTWDDHDYGANDAGNDLHNRNNKPMSSKEEMEDSLFNRQNAYLDFLGVSSNNIHRRNIRTGVYSSALIGSGTKQVLIILLDTRTNRDLHCIPSWASFNIPYMGSIGGTVVALFSCITRWFTAKILWHPWLYNFSSRYICSSSQDKEGSERTVLGHEQWTWLEGLLQTYSNASSYIIVSSIQVLTTNPAPESWGHFDKDRTRLLRLVKDLPGLVLLSGDVHHAEISSSSSSTHHNNSLDDEIVEVTSSGLTHSVHDMGSVIAPLAKYQINMFSNHRRRIITSDTDNNIEKRRRNNVYIGKNYGTIDFHWDVDQDGSVNSNNNQTSNSSLENNSYMKVNVHNENGTVVLTTDKLSIGSNSSASSHIKKRNINVDAIPKIFKPVGSAVGGESSWKDVASNLSTLLLFCVCFILLPACALRKCLKVLLHYCSSSKEKNINSSKKKTN